LKHVGGLLSLAALTRPPVDKMPAAYVMPGDEKYGSNGLLNAVRQLGQQSVTVIVLVKNAAPEGDDVFNPVADLQTAIFGQLVGWQPDASDGALLVSACRLLNVQPNFLTYQMTFLRDHTLRA
jgi:hypothetical protein